MAVDPEDEEFDLRVSLETVAIVIDHAHAIQEEDETDADEDADEPDGSDAELDEESLSAFISELNEEEQTALIALAWVGRGDYEAEEWEEALKVAAERGAGKDTATYLLTMDMLGDLLGEGLAAFGIAAEEIER
ncbi:uncharacterized protein DUF3775 [Humitalea rosea]|uniref:Uncharacterized protein DUF3775 n=1 Tax=Humitalea rosea TaxID=990373 RepID=A0A2W7IIK8_9PROT|nr:DUF3775 domain-containing protein [Humitalea rosea]PZW45009.1 uncharacterized protein DUF3775 [Humitalea rosea]